MKELKRKVLIIPFQPKKRQKTEIEKRMILRVFMCGVRSDWCSRTGFSNRNFL